MTVLLKSGEYKLGDSIDKGGFGEVFKGEKVLSLKKTVAIKRCKLLTGHEKNGTPNPLHEAAILKELSKDSDAKHVIAEYYDSFCEGDYHYLVMEFCPYGSIYKYLLQDRKRPFNEDQTSEVMLNVLMALDIIHGAGYVHRDLSPKNILIYSFSDDSMPIIRIVDFGLSKKISLVKNTVAGTPGFFDADMMRSGLTMDVDFYALGCVMFFMLTSQLMISKENRENRLTPRDIESKMKHSGLSKEATDLVLLLTSKQKFESSKQIKMDPFFTKKIIQEAHIQASSIRKSIGQTTERETHREPFKELQNRQSELSEMPEQRYQFRRKFDQRPLKAPSQAFSLPTNLGVRHQRSKLSVAPSNSPLLWPFPPDIKDVVKNVMVNKFGRAILRGRERIFICETLNYNDKSKCTYVGRLINAGRSDQELRIYKPNSVFMLPDFNTYPNGIPETELKLIDRITRGDELDCSDSKAARTMYTRMKSIYRAVCDMVRKREENPCLVVDTLAKITWGGTISVELADKETVRWNCRNGVGPPFRDHSHLSQEVNDMLLYVHKDFSQLFAQRTYKRV